MMTAAARQAGGKALNRLLQGFVAEGSSVPVIEVSGLGLDSRAIQPGELFVALAGHRTHGLQHGEQAVRAGCAAIVFDPAGGGELLARGFGSVPCIAVNNLGHVLGPIADRFFDEPSSRLQTIGITGTNGKTSSSHFLAAALSQSVPAGVVGTLGWGMPGQLRTTTHTTPDAIEVHRLLAEMAGEGFGAAALEASSHGLVQGRLNGIRFIGALFTNLSRDHLDYHGTMENYLAAKLLLLDWPGLQFAVFNGDDPIGEAVKERLPTGCRAIAFSLRGAICDKAPTLLIENVRHQPDGVSFRARWEDRQAEMAAPVFGDFNVQNLAGTLGVLLALGWDLDRAAAALKSVRPVPGRMESFAGPGFPVIVDYAHTPDALESVLTSLRSHVRRRLWVVFGCGGDRDKGKRPQMGGIAERLADRVVITDDNPRSEDGDAIIRDIRSGCGRTDLLAIRDRREAIAHALNDAETGDIVLIAGKGHETTQEIHGEKFSFSDREVVQSILSGMGEKP